VDYQLGIYIGDKLGEQMSRITKSFLQRQTEQSVTSKVSNLVVVTRSGPNSQSQLPKNPKSPERPKEFIVGASIVGEGDTIQ
jgi:hypothetical protein